MFADLTHAQLEANGDYVRQEHAQLYALADLIWGEVHRLDGLRSEVAIRCWLTEMEQILKRKRRRR